MRLKGRFDALEGRFDTLEGRLDAFVGRFDALEGFDSPKYEAALQHLLESRCSINRNKHARPSTTSENLSRQHRKR